MEVSSMSDKQEKQILLDKEHETKSCQCHRKWSTFQLILFSIVIAILAAGLASFVSNIDRIIDNNDTRNDILTRYCPLGVYDGPDVSIPDDWHWGYGQHNGPSIWPKYYPQCGCSNGQSPIKIDSESVKLSTPRQFCTDSNLLQWTINTNYTQKYNGTYQVVNNGHSIVMRSINYDNNKLEPVAILKNQWQPLNSSLHSEFVLDSVHFHWGTDTIDGSNVGGHELDGIDFPLEAHFVHYSTDYDTITESIDDWSNLYDLDKDRYVLAVVAVFYEGDEVGNVTNPAFDQLLKSTVLNSTHGEVGYVEQIDLMDFLPNDRDSYYYYSGSLTSPPCQPIVRWHVLSTTLAIHQAQMDKFRSLADDVVEENWRSHQFNSNPVYGCHVDYVETV